MDQDEVEVIKTPKRTRPIFSHLDRTTLVNKGFIIWPKTKSFLSGSTREIVSRQDGPILPARVANQNIGFAHLARSQSLPYNNEIYVLN